MLQLKQIWKSILKYKVSSGLTLLSLIISFTGIIILTLYVSWEKSYDRFHKDIDSIYRLETVLYGEAVPATIGKTIKTEIPEVTDLTALAPYFGGTISTSELLDKNIKFETKAAFAEQDFFNIFSFPLTLGDRNTALEAPHSAVISESFAKKLFEETNVIGKYIVAQGIEYKVTGIMKNIPKNSSIQADCLFSFSTYKVESCYSRFEDDNECSFNIYLKLNADANIDLACSKINQIDKFQELTQEVKGIIPEGSDLFSIRPLKEVHFTPSYLGSSNYANPVLLNVFILLIVILTIMGAVNFINFATSQAPLRSKSLSISRVLGENRFASMAQITLESVIISLVAMTISYIIYRLSYHCIESMFSIEGLGIEGRYYFIPAFFVFAFIFGIMAGTYPSKYITSPPLAQSVKGQIHFSGKGKSIRNALVISQFVFTIGLISSALIIEKQLNYWRNFDIGINKEHVVYLSTTYGLATHYQAFADELLKNNNITDYTYTGFIPGQVEMGWGQTIDGQYIQMKCWPVDENFLSFFNIKMDEGRAFMDKNNSDINSFILNKKGLEKFGWENPFERQIEGFDWDGPIIGIAENFNFSSLKDDVEPMVFWRTNRRKDHLLLRLAPGNYTQTIAYIKKTASIFDTENPIEVKFLDDSLNALYAKEENSAHFIEFITLWTILLSVTGLLGLIFFISRERIKEIGIRKVNGATISEVLTMLNMDFIKWIAIAFVIATPIAWIAMNKWLESFAYKTTLSWWIFALAGVLALGIALLTVSWQSWKAATRNPVEALRYE